MYTLIMAVNKWYDNIPEPWRFLLAMLLCLPAIYAMEGMFGRQVAVLSMFYLVLIVFIRMSGFFLARERSEMKKRDKRS